MIEICTYTEMGRKYKCHLRTAMLALLPSLAKGANATVAKEGIHLAPLDQSFVRAVQTTFDSVD